MIHLTTPDDDVLRALTRLEDDHDWQTFMGYMTDQAGPVIVERLKRQANEVPLRWSQGAAQLIDDVKELAANAVAMLAKRMLQQQKEGTKDV